MIVLENLVADGSIERLLLVILVYGPMAYLWATHGAVDDRLIDIGLVILGFYFGTVVNQASNSRAISRYLRENSKDSTTVLSPDIVE